MRTTLLRSLLVLLALLGLATGQAAASHLMGGEMTYRYLDANGPAAAPFRYEVTVTIYTDNVRGLGVGGINGTRPAVEVAIYNRSQGNVRIPMTAVNGPTCSPAPPNMAVDNANDLCIARGASVVALPPTPSGCTIPNGNIPVRITRYTTIVNLPLSFAGYYAVYSDNARNDGLENIANSGGTRMTLYMEMAPPLIPNSSPTFADTAVAIICQGDTSLVLNNAVDADGDRLIYSFGTPSGGVIPPGTFTPPPTPATYNTGFSAAQPFGPGAGSYASLNASTGLSKYAAPQIGEYAVAVDVREYRRINGTEVLVGVTRRDVQLVSRTCPPNNAPQLTPASTSQRTFTLEEGETISFPVAATDADGNNLNLRAGSVLLDGAGGFNATFNNQEGVVPAGSSVGNASVTGTGGNVSGVFRFTARCGDGRPTPYDVSITATDNGCPIKLVADVFQIFVNKAAAPTRINGDTTICDRTVVRTYTAVGPVPTGGYNWRVTGGTIQGPATGNNVQVLWSNTGQGRITLKNVSAFGCLSDSVSRDIQIQPASTLAVSGNTSICLGQSAILTVTGGSGTYVWTAGSQTFTGPRISVSPTQTTTYTVTSTTGTCTDTRQITVTVSPVAVANAGADATVCSGTSVTLGAASVAGQTYQWSPATGLSSATAAQPTFSQTLAPGSAPQTITYTVTTTTGQGCTATDQVTVTLNPAAVANAGTDPSFCSGASAQLGAAPQPGYSYQWSPATGLSSPTVAQPTVSLINTTSATQSFTYTVTVTTAEGCTATDQVTVTVNPAAVAEAGSDLSLCSGATVQLGALARAGYRYQWSPATGLSNATIAQPFFSQTLGPGSAPLTTVYTVTATTAEGCTATDQVTVTLNPAASANAGADATLCSGASAALGTAAAFGQSYQWSPATGLSSATAAQPTFSLTNTTGTVQTFTYTVTATTTQGCTATDQVTVTLNPAAVAAAGPSRAFCSGTTTQIGTPALPGYTYQWSPAAGLSSATAAQPTVTLTTGSTPTVQTYTVTATSPEGCTATSQVTVTVNPAAIAQAGADVAFCSGASVQLGTAATAGSTYAWSPATGLSSATTARPQVTLTNTGTTLQSTTYTLTVTTTEGCTATDQVVVTVNPAAVAAAGPNLTLCSGESRQLGSAPLPGYTYSWSPSTALSNPTVAQPTFSATTNPTGAPLTFTYTLTATTAEGCSATSQVTVTVNPAAVASAGTDATFCSGGTALLGNAASVIAGTTYQWSPTTGLANPTSATSAVTLTHVSNVSTAPLVTKYVLTATTTLGCVARDTVEVTVNPKVVAFAGTDKTVCSGQSTPIGTTALYPTGTTFAWSPTTGVAGPTASFTSVTLTNTTASPLVSRYVLTATTLAGCVSRDTIDVTVNPAAVVNAGVDATLCSEKSTRLGTPALAGYSYQWSPAANLSSATAAQPTFTANVATAQTITYTVTATNPQGCTATDQVLVTVNPRPATDSIQGSASVCPQVTGVAYTIRNPRNTAYQWKVTGGTIVSGQGTPAITVDWQGASTTAKVEAFQLNQFGCSSDTVVFPVRINQILATQKPAGPLQVCQAEGPFTYQTQYTNGSVYSWQIIGGTQVSTNLASVQVQWTRPGINKIVVTENSSTAGGTIRCLGVSDTLYVTVNPSPVLQQLVGPTRFCTGTTATFTLPRVSNGLYQWSLNNVVIPGVTGITVSLPSLAPGTYLLTARETNAAGCQGLAASHPFTVDPLPAAATVVGPRQLCPESLSGLSYTINNASSSSTFQWTVTGGTIVSGNGTGSITVNFNPTAASRTVVVQETSQFGCAGPATTITLPLDNATVALNTASVDQTDDRKVVVALSVPNNAGNTNQVRILRRDAGTGTFAQVGTAPNTATSFTDTGVDADAKSYDYRVELTNACGTLLSSTQHTTIRATIQSTEPGAGRAEGTVKVGWNAYAGFPVKQYELYRQADGGALELVKTVPATAAATYTEEFASSRAGFAQSFRVKAISTDAQARTAWSNGADASFENKLEFFNVITPNNDGLNETFYIRSVELYPGNTLTILNRWGREVYKTTNYLNTWNAPDQPAGTYYFLFKQANGTVTRGTFEVVK
ncbi:hypothetical protein F0P96_18475 [Hymenobacter busanensis]|uniref:PKD-like domain-containing protein n=1 Tax=Hymenobacter busanensis TaxID=2607656 RepID=A0A7L4ZSY9_9BACT|nr:PKD-like domain-containing protein [Hymenobacter busanensis]KAA9327220.1 hypothetical protein F0P96_18475 [Hymenobacter busanensis]QHJ05886.1 hypothetical protein GUY19_00680 [Hymenobacter busanensis]